MKKISFEERYDKCLEVSKEKGQLFLGFTETVDKINRRSKCKLYCKKSGIYWETTSIEKHISRKGCPCGECSLHNKKLKSEKLITEKIKNVCSKYNIQFLGFKDDVYKGTTTKVVLKCLIDGNVWDTTEARAIANEVYKGSGCRVCKTSRIKSYVDEGDSEIIQDLETNYGYAEGTKFWRSERTTPCNSRNYFKYVCPKCSHDEYVENGLCSGAFESFIGSIKAGNKACRCSKGFRWTD